MARRRLPAGARARALEVVRRLQSEYPEPRCALVHTSALQLLVATILSAQTTDERVNQVTPALFARWPTADALAAAGQDEVEEVIRVLKSQLSLEGCQAGYKRSCDAASRPWEGAQEHHIALCLVAYLLVERERLEHGDTWRQRKRQLILTGPQGTLPALERIRSSA